LDSHFPLYNLFIKYLEGKCSPEEIRQLLLYFDDNANEEVLESLIRAELGFISTKGTDERMINAAVTRVKSVIIHEIKERNDSYTNKNSKGHFSIRTWMKIAAIWLAFITSAFLIVNHYLKNKEKAPIFKFAATQPGQRKLIHLFDGTNVWLSPSSTIKYKDQLVNNYREVTLDGEAFFEVAKDKVHPFIIHSGRMQTEVVGTTFNVKSYSKQNIYDVTVVTGIVKVAMLSAKKEKLSEVILKPKQQAILNNAQATLTNKSVTTVDAVIKKRDGILSYDGTPVPEVVADFRRYFNKSIEIENKSATCLCYGEFDTSKPIDIALRQLAAAIGATVRPTEKGYLIEGGCGDK
jgi:ferric-dicitrate binding protein FerR (iron transport regulator)